MKNQSDIIMENIAVIDRLKYERFSDTIIDRIERTLNPHEALLDCVKSYLDTNSNGKDLSDGEIVKIKRLIKSAESK